MKQVLKLAVGTALLILLPQAGIGGAVSTPLVGWELTTVDTADDVGSDTSIALDSSGAPRISYHDRTNGTLKFASWTGSEWALETVDDTDYVGRWSSLALDASGNPRIAYALGSSFVYSRLKYASWTGANWNLETVDTQAQGVGWHASLALDIAGNAHIAYWKSYGRNALKYARWTGSSWEIQEIDKGDHLGQFPSIALDSSGTPRISYRGYDTEYRLNYIYSSDNKWKSETLDSAGGVTGSATSLVLDASGNPQISYYDSGILKYARWNPVSEAWVLEVVDALGDVGRYSSLVLDSSGNPHISYYDLANSDLKYARWTGLVWEITVVDSAGEVGSYSSLALDGSDNPHISYYDATNGDLKYASVSNQCVSDLDCNDSNDCTIDWCDTADSTCNHSAVADNLSCNAGTSICCSGLCVTPACSLDAPCDDGEDCTVDTCMSPSTCSAVCDFVWPNCGGPTDGCCPPGCSDEEDADCAVCIPTHSFEKNKRCSDGLDNDCDGMIDGEDPDC